MTRYKMTQKVKDLTGSRKREFSFGTTDRPISTNSYWDGGSRREYEVFNRNTGDLFTPSGGRYPWCNPEDRGEYTLTPGDIMIETGSLCGKPATPYIGCRTDELEAVKKWLGISA